MPTIIEKYNAGMVTQVETVITKIRTDVNPKNKSLKDLADVNNDLLPLDGDLLQYNDDTKQFTTISPEILSIEKGSLTKTFTAGESSIITLNNTMNGTPIVTATKEQASTEITDTTWDVEVDGSDYDIQDFAYDDTVTPSATSGDITLTLGSGAWSAEDVGKTISGNGGEAVLTATDGTAKVKTNFNDTLSIASGLWTLKGLIFDANSGVEISNYSVSTLDPTLTINTPAYSFDTAEKFIHSAIFASGNIIIVRQDDASNYGQFIIVAKDNSTIVANTTFSAYNTTFVDDVLITNDDNALIIFSEQGGNNEVFFMVIDESGSTVKAKTSLFTDGYASECNALLLNSGEIFIVASIGNNLRCVVLNPNTTIKTTDTLILDMGFTAALGGIHLLDNGNIFISYTGYSEKRVRYLTVNNEGTLVTTSVIAMNLSTARLETQLLSTGEIFMVCSDSVNQPYQANYKILNQDLTTKIAETEFIASATLTNAATSIIALDGGDMIIFFSTATNGTYTTAIHYAIMDNNGLFLKNPTEINATNSDYVTSLRYPDGDIFLGWGGPYVDSQYLTIDNPLSSTTLSASNQYLSTTTNTNGQIDTSLWLDINSMTSNDAINGGEVLYAVSTDNQVTFQITQTGQLPRNIARYNIDTWEYNSDTIYGNETWTPATINDKLSTLAEAMNVAANRMTGVQLDAIQDSEHFDLGDTLDLAIILYTSDSTKVPSSDGVSIDADTIMEQKGAVNGTDYTWSKKNDTKVEIKALTAGNYKIRII